MNELSDRIGRVEESQTIGMAKKSRELAAAGIPVVSFHFGEPDFDTPDHIKNAAIEAIKNGFTKYTPVPGTLELRKSISAKFERENGLIYPFDQIVVSTGAKHSIMNVICSIINHGDEVIIPTPFWVSYSEMVKYAGGIPVLIKSTIENDFKPDFEAIKKAINAKTKAFLFSNPCNPSGSVFSKNELQNLADIFDPHPEITIISDEIYEHLNFSGKHESIAGFGNLKERTVTVNGVSKSFAMTGWRIGYIGGPKKITDACEKLQSQFTSGTNSIAQKAAEAALNSDMSPTFEMKEAYISRRDIMVSELAKISGLKINKPEGAFYVFPEISSFFGKSFNGFEIRNDLDLAEYLLKEAHVSVVPGGAFGNPECIRMSYATDEQTILIGCSAIKMALDKLS